MNDKIKVLFLDIDNTLLDFDAAAAWAMEQCFQKAGLEYKSEMFAAFTEENNKIWQRIERKELTMDDLFYVRWQAILGHLGLEADGVEMEKEFRVLLNLSAVPVEGAEEILTYLKQQKYCLCAASNGPYDQQINRLKKADMLKYFAHCFVSEKVGADKPSQRFFDGCLKELPGVRPGGMYDDRRFPDRRYYRWQGVWNVHLLVCAFCGKIQRRKRKKWKTSGLHHS